MVCTRSYFVSKVDKQREYIGKEKYLADKAFRQNIVNESREELSSEIAGLQRKINAYQCHKLACRLEQYAASLRMNANFFEALEDTRRYSIKVEEDKKAEKDQTK